MRSMRGLIVALAGLAVIGAAGAFAAGGKNGLFLVQCDLSHRLSDDPIVFHHHEGAAHSHEFFANTSTDAHSTLASMRRAGTTCRRPEDRSGYWLPSLYKYGKRVAASMVTVYYTTGRRNPASIQPLPDGLKMIAGGAHGKGGPDPLVVQWSCGAPGAFDNKVLGRRAAKRHLRRARTEVRRLKRRRAALRRDGKRWNTQTRRLKAVNSSLRRSRKRLRAARSELAPSALPNCPQGHRVRLSLRFPDCWDGRRLDSRDHKSHMAYSPPLAGERSCPATHPVVVPVVTFSISWPIADGEGVRLSSGKVRTMHGDVFSAWNRGTLAYHVSRCLRIDTGCESR